MRKIQKKYRKLLKNDENCIIIEMHPNNVKKITIELASATPSGQSDIFVFNNGQVVHKKKIENISQLETKGVKKGEKMKIINALNASYFLIQLYYKTKRIPDSGEKPSLNIFERKDIEKYYCTNTHIEKLLVIVNLIAFCNEEILITEDMLVNTCGVGIPILRGFLDSTIINGISDSKEINKDLIDESIDFPERYNINETLDDGTRDLLTNVFLRFGAYDAGKLGEMFDAFKNYISIPNSKNIDHPIITKNMTKSFFLREDIPDNIKSNILYDYIKNYKIKE